MGPLFTPPGSQGLPWLRLLPLLAAAPAGILLTWALVRGRLPRILLSSGVLLVAAVYLFGALTVVEESKQVQFCGS